MEMQPIEQKKSFLRNDRLLVCGMFVFYGICIIGALGGAFWGLNRKNQRIAAYEAATAIVAAAQTGIALPTQQASSTQTAIIQATEQVEASATAAVRIAEQDQYKYIERFDTFTGDWFAGEEDGYGDMLVSIKDGVYQWEIKKDEGYVQSEDFPRRGTYVKDYDTYVDIKFVDIPQNEETCAGLAFRTSTSGWRSAAYVFYMCNDEQFVVGNITGGSWSFIHRPEHSNAINSHDWNRIAVSAIDDHFTFTINNTRVLEITDTRRRNGWISLLVDPPGDGTEVWFDNFGFQPH